MKKKYFNPEFELVKFSFESIMASGLIESSTNPEEIATGGDEGGEMGEVE